MIIHESFSKRRLIISVITSYAVLGYIHYSIRGKGTSKGCWTPQHSRYRTTGIQLDCSTWPVQCGLHHWPASCHQATLVYASSSLRQQPGNPMSIKWRHGMETLSALLALCMGNPPFTGGFPPQRVSDADTDVFFDVSLNTQSIYRWFETP